MRRIPHEKVGLLFIDNQFTIDDEKGWDEISMAERCLYQMPSTTNTLEATHCHLNKRTPRRNTFYQSIFRIFRELSAKYLAINDRIKHNYMYTVSKTQQKLMCTSYTEINNMIAFYESSVDSCN